MKRSETGKKGELAAAEFLRRAGCEIVATNFRTRLGEIDIIACDGCYLIFAEVKTRAQGSMILPREAVDVKKQQKILLAVGEYLSQNPTSLQPRLDVIEVVTRPGEAFEVKSINHIQNAFSAS